MQGLQLLVLRSCSTLTGHVDDQQNLALIDQDDVDQEAWEELWSELRGDLSQLLFAFGINEKHADKLLK